MNSSEEQPPFFTFEWLIALSVLWIVSAGCTLLMIYFSQTGSRYLQDGALEGAVGLMLAQHVMTISVGVVTVRINRRSRPVVSAACVLIGLTLLQGMALLWIWLR